MSSVSDWADLMPHRIRVKTAVQLDDYGYPVGEAKDTIYACLLDDKIEVEYTQSGPRSVLVHKAYVNPYPILENGTFAENAAIITVDTKIWTPDDDQHEITSVATHYSEDGLPHNQELTYN